MLVEEDNSEYNLAKQNLVKYVQQGRQKLNDQDRKQFDLSQAIVYEHDKKLINAAQLYYSLSINLNSMIYYEKALRLALLSQAGPKRQGILATLSRDSRSSKSNHQEFLVKNLRIQLLRWEEINKFEYNIVFREHIVMALSKLYENIKLEKIQLYLNNLDELEVLGLLEKMIIQEQLKAKIDLVDGYVYFIEESNQGIEQFCTNLYKLANEIQSK